MNSFPLRSSSPVPRSLTALASLLEAPAPEREMEVRGIAPLGLATSHELGLVAHRRYLRDLAGSGAGALLVSRTLVELLPPDERPRLVVEDAHQALAVLLDLFHPEAPAAAEIHATAILGKGVQLGRGTRVGPYVVIEEGSVVGDGSSLGAHVVVGAGCRIGAGSVLHPHVTLYPGSVLGDRVIVHAGACLGADGFGYVFRDGQHRKVPQVGSCVVEDDVEIGANTTIDRGSIGATRIEAGAKIDNLVQLGHNVVVGRRSILTGQVGVAGSTHLGADVLVGGQVGLAGHLTVGDGARLAGQAGVTADVPAGETVMGFPARPRAEFLRTTAAQSKVPELLGRVRLLEEALERHLAGGGDGEDGSGGR